MDSSTLTRLLSELGKWHAAVAAAFEAADDQPTVGSKAWNELKSSPGPVFLRTAYSQGMILIEVAADLFTSFTRSLTEPVLTIAPWIEACSLIEASAIAAWLLDPAIDAEERIGRSFAFRIRGLDQELKFANAVPDSVPIDQLQARIAKVEMDANSLGYRSFHNDKGRLIGLGQVAPSSTQLIGMCLGEEGTYRMLSGFAHGHAWALQTLGFRKVGDRPSVLLEKGIEPWAILFMALKIVQAFKVPVGHRFDLFGWDPLDAIRTRDSVLKLIFDLNRNAHYPLQSE